MAAELTIRQMIASDIDHIIATFFVWHKTRPQYERYFTEQQLGKRIVLLACFGPKVVGYGTLLWHSRYEPHRLAGIPEIVDLNVISEHQRQGIGTALITALERTASQHGKPVVGIGVEQTPPYAAARRLYPKLGYQPDGLHKICNVLYLSKQL